MKAPLDKIHFRTRRSKVKENEKKIHSHNCFQINVFLNVFLPTVVQRRKFSCSDVLICMLVYCTRQGLSSFILARKIFFEGSFRHINLLSLKFYFFCKKKWRVQQDDTRKCMADTNMFFFLRVNVINEPIKIQQQIRLCQFSVIQSQTSRSTSTNPFQTFGIRQWNC